MMGKICNGHNGTLSERGCNIVVWYSKALSAVWYRKNITHSAVAEEPTFADEWCGTDDCRKV